VRAHDIEPYTGLRYLSRLFQFMSVILLVLLAAEIITGLYTQGAASIPTLLGEASRLIVIAGVLWGTGDLAHLLMDVGHDVRATRILAARVVSTGRVLTQGAGSERGLPGDRGLVVERTTEIKPVADRGFDGDGGGKEPPPIP